MRYRWSVLLILLLGLALPCLSVAQNRLINGGETIVGAVNYCDAAGSSGDTYVCALSPAITTYTTGACYVFKAPNASTASGGATLNLNSLGAKTIKKPYGGVTTDLADNDIQANQFVTVCYDGTNMLMMSQAGALPLASETAPGIVELATAAETTTGTDNTRAVSPDGLAGSVFGTKYITIECVPDATALTTGDGKCYFPIHPDFDTWQVVTVSAHVGAAVSSSGAVTVAIDRCGAVATGIRCSGTNVDVLSTNITIDANEDGTETAAPPAVINTANDDLATGQWLRFNIDGAGTGTQGLYVTVGIRKP